MSGRDQACTGHAKHNNTREAAPAAEALPAGCSEQLSVLPGCRGALKVRLLRTFILGANSVMTPQVQVHDKALAV